MSNTKQKELKGKICQIYRVEEWFDPFQYDERMNLLDLINAEAKSVISELAKNTKHLKAADMAMIPIWTIQSIKERYVS